jgi:hypothetical protein
MQFKGQMKQPSIHGDGPGVTAAGCCRDATSSSRGDKITETLHACSWMVGTCTQHLHAAFTVVNCQKASCFDACMTHPKCFSDIHTHDATSSNTHPPIHPNPPAATGPPCRPSHLLCSHFHCRPQAPPCCWHDPGPAVLPGQRQAGGRHRHSAHSPQWWGSRAAAAGCAVLDTACTIMVRP